MSGLTIHLLTCDGTDDGEVCDAEVPSLAALREQAKPEGWWSADGRDLCPDHRPTETTTPEEGTP